MKASDAKRPISRVATYDTWYYLHEWQKRRFDPYDPLVEVEVKDGWCIRLNRLNGHGRKAFLDIVRAP